MSREPFSRLAHVYTMSSKSSSFKGGKQYDIASLR